MDTIKDINKAEQQELPLKLQGENISDLPEDLYIPPNSLRIFLDSFEGPLDLLLYFIKKQNLDIANIDVSLITDQYISYINLMEELQFDLAGEYLVMSAYLAEIKSRILLPSLSEDDEMEDDPRSELIRRLQEYERYKKASESLNDIPMVNRDFYLASAAKPEFEASKEKPKITGEDLVLIFNELKERISLNKSHVIDFEELSTRERMTEILELLQQSDLIAFNDLIKKSEGKMGVAVVLLAIMELLKDSLIMGIQNEPFGKIHLSKKITGVH